MIQPSIARTSVAEFLADRMATSDKTQKQIAEECGFEHPNIITMFKKGLTKVPINRIAPLARALEIDAAHLLRLVMLEYFPDTWESIENIMQSTVLTANELDLIRSYRRVTGDSDCPAVVKDGNSVIAIVSAKDDSTSFMRGISDKSANQVCVSGGRWAHRTLIEDADHGWRVFPTDRVLSAYRGDGTLPELANRTTRLALVTLRTESGKETRIHSASICAIAINEEGWIDQDALQARLVEQLDGAQRADVETVTESDRSMFKRLLGLVPT